MSKTRAGTRLSWKMRVATALLIAFTVWHLAFTVLYNMPKDNLTRINLGAGIEAYSSPIFQQDWRYFAVPPRYNVRIVVSAEYLDSDTKLVSTGPVDITERQDVDARYNPLPPKHRNAVYQAYYYYEVAETPLIYDGLSYESVVRGGLTNAQDRDSNSMNAQVAARLGDSNVPSDIKYAYIRTVNEVAKICAQTLWMYGTVPSVEAIERLQIRFVIQPISGFPKKEGDRLLGDRVRELPWMTIASRVGGTHR